LKLSYGFVFLFNKSSFVDSTSTATFAHGPKKRLLDRGNRTAHLINAWSAAGVNV
jgi:hypothetical protein